MFKRPWGSNWEIPAKGIWNDGPSFEEHLGNVDAPPVARRHLAYGGGKGGGGGTTYNSQATTIPPEVLARYNAVNSRAETAAATPFENYGGEFVAPVNQTQQGGVDTIAGAAGTVDPYFGAGTAAVVGGLGAAQPYFGTATGQVANAASTGAGLNSQALGTLNAGLGAAQPFNAAAGNAYGNAYAGAQPYQMGATGLALAGTGQVNPGALNINGFMSPYNDAVVQSTLNLVDQQQGRDLRSQRDQQIMSGGFGGDGANIGRAVLQGQQGLARANVASNLYNQNYSQALGAAQQQQGVGLGAAQSNRAALTQGATTLAGLGQQGFTQGLGLGQAQQGLGQQIYGQGAGASQGQAAIGQQGFTQGLGAANANLGIGQGIYGMGANAATTLAGLGTGLQGAQLQQGQAQIGAGTIGQQTQQAQDQALYNQFLQQQGYPFQTAQFLANIAEGTGALSGSTTSGYSAAPQPFFSDERLKEDIRTIGHTKDGLRIVTYRYKGSPHTQIGMLAQDVEKKRPEAVGLAGGYKTVDYAAATRKALGGAVANDNAWGGYAGGGMAGLDQAGLAQLLMAHQAMYPGGAHDRAGATSGSGPRGLQLRQPIARSLPTPQAPRPTPEQEPALRSALRTANEVTSAGKGVGDAYSAGKAIYGKASDLYDRVAHGSTDSQIADWSKYGTWPGDAPTGGLGGAGANSTGSITSEPLPAPATAAPQISSLVDGTSNVEGVADVAAALPADVDLVSDAFSLLARRGGRIKRYANGGMPFGGAEGYIPDELYEPLDPSKLANEQKGLGVGQQQQQTAKSGTGSSGGSGGLGDAAKLVGQLAPLAMMFLKRGGRAGFADGGLPMPVEEIGDQPGGTDLDYYDRTSADERRVQHPVLQDPLAGQDARRRGRGLSPAVEPDPSFTDNVVPFPAPTRGLTLPPKPDVAAPTPSPMTPPSPTGLAPPPTMPAPRPVQAADNFDALENVIQRHWTQESGQRQFKPDGTPVMSPKGAVGYTQMQAAGPEAAKLAGVAWDPERLKTDESYNRLLGDTWFKHLNETYKDPYKAAAAYNAGQGALGNAMRLTETKGGNYWDHLPAETQNHLYIISGGKIGKPAQGNMQSQALSLVGSSPTATGNTSTTSPAGLGTGSVDLAIPPRDRKDGSWLDRNERTIVTGLTFLGNMLGSPSRQLAGAVGHGLAAAAPAFFEMGNKQQHAGQEQQQIQLGGQRLSITERAQYINLMTMMQGQQAVRVAAGQPRDPAIDAQIAYMSKIVNGTTSPGATLPGGVTPASTPPATPSPTGATGNPTPLQPTGGSASPAPTTPNAPPEVAAKLKDLPPQLSNPEFRAQVHPEQNPLELYRRAGEIAAAGDPKGTYAAALARADRAAQDLKERGYTYDKNMMPIRVPGMSETMRSQQMIPLNTAWSAKESGANVERQTARQSLDIIRGALEELQTHAGAEITAGMQRWAKAAGIEIPSTAKTNAAVVQELIKQTAARAAGGGDTDMARSLTRAASIDPTKEPEANKQILAQSYADLNARDAEYKFLQPRVSAVPQLDTPYERERWATANPRRQFYEDAYKDLAVRGATPDDLSKFKTGHTYIIEPDSALAKQSGIKLTEPTKYRVIVNEDGKRVLRAVTPNG